MESKSRARLNPRHQQMVREKIRATQLINRLQKYALARIDDESAMMDKGQVSAALGLLRKCVSDLTNTELNGTLDVRTAHSLKIEFIEGKE